METKKRQPLDPDLDYISVNQLLGELASFGIIPAELVLPWGCCFLLGFLLGMAFSQPFGVSLFISVWLCGAWFLVAGKRSHHFTDRLIPLPGKDWIDASTLFVPATEPGAFRRCTQKPIPPIKVTTPDGKTETFMAFQKEVERPVIVEIEMQGYKFAAILMYSKGQWAAEMPFKWDGIHTELYREEVLQYAEATDEMVKSLFPGEFLTLSMGCRSDYSTREEELQRQQTNSLPLIGLFIESEKRRGQQLTAQGKRQVWEQVIFCSWTQRRASSRHQDWLGKGIGWLEKAWTGAVRSLTGSQKTYWENVYAHLGVEIFRDGFLPALMSLETKAGWSVSSFDGVELYHYLYYRFNQKRKNPKTGRSLEPPLIPQLIRIFETPQGIQVDIQQNSPKDLVSTLIEGGHCPGVRGRDTVWVNDSLVAVMTMTQRPAGFKNLRSELKWISEKISEPHVRDTDVWVQVTPEKPFLVRDNLIRITKQSSHANKYAFKGGSVMDVNATERQREALDAQRLLYEDKRPVKVAVTFLIYRQTSVELDKACALLSNSFGSVQLVRDKQTCWKQFSEILPLNTKRLQTSTSVFSERRLSLDSSTVAGVLPLTKPKSLDRRGVEYLSVRGGCPLHLDLFTDNLTALITGIRGSGKSVHVFAYIRDALARGIPVVGLDASLAGDSTFKLIAEILGEAAAYIELTRKRFNILQPPDLRGFPSSERKRRMNIWLDRLRQILATMALGNSNDPNLRDRVDALIVKLLNAFLSDPFVIDSYNQAFEGGWRSRAWQKMPTLGLLLTYCSREKLGLQSFEDIDRRAINQIVQQIGAKLLDPNIGLSIGAPSDFAPSPLVTFFSFSGLTNENNSLIMSLVAQMACLNVGLSPNVTI